MSKEKRNGFVDDTKRQVWIDGRFFEAIPKGDSIIRGDVWIRFSSLSFAPAYCDNACSHSCGGHYREVVSVEIQPPKVTIGVEKARLYSYSSPEARSQIAKLLPPPMKPCPYQEWRKTQPKEALVIVDFIDIDSTHGSGR